MNACCKESPVSIAQNFFQIMTSNNHLPLLFMFLLSYILNVHSLALIDTSWRARNMMYAYPNNNNWTKFYSIVYFLYFYFSAGIIFEWIYYFCVLTGHSSSIQLTLKWIRIHYCTYNDSFYFLIFAWFFYFPFGFKCKCTIFL